MQPEKLGPFRIGRALGRGGMGAVYEGVNERTDEHVAVKVLLSTLEDDEDVRKRFEAEIDTLKRLRHPNIVRLFGFGEEQDLLYYVMELIDGPSLHQEIRKKRLFEWHEVAKIGLEMCFALKHGHDRGITHRDIKPANILLNEQGEIKLSDYGIAQFFGSQQHLTEAHSIVGTLEYMSPEQALAMPVGPRSDIYSLGAVLYTLLAGKPPYSAKNLIDIVRKHQSNSFESIRADRVDVPDEMEAIVFDLLKPQPEDRPHNAYLIAKRFQSLLQALVGPPELIHVKPMTSETPVRKLLGSISFLDPSKREGKTPISPPLNTREGVIDLGGIVSAPTETHDNLKEQQSDPPVGSTSLANSFGLRDDLLGPTKVHQPDSTLALEETDSTQFLLGNSIAKNLPISHAPKPEMLKSIEKRETEQTFFEVNEHSSSKKLFGVEEKTEPSNLAVDKVEVKRDDLTVHGLNALPGQGKEVSADEPESYALQGAENEKSHSNKTSTHTQNPATAKQLTASRFVKVDEAELDDYDLIDKKPKPVISAQTLFASISLILIGVLVWYFLQPVSPDALYDRIKKTLNINDDSVFLKRDRNFQDDESLELSPRALRSASEDIDSFLKHYANHPKADMVRYFEDQLELANKERQLERYRQFSGPQKLIPVERAFLDAIATAKTDPEKTISGLRAMIDLYSSDKTNYDVSEEEAIAKENISLQSTRPRQRLSRSEQCIEVARQRLKKLESDISTIRIDQINFLKQRLADANQIEKNDRVRADKIRSALIELYQDRDWADGLVQQAKADLGRQKYEPIDKTETKE